MTPPKDSRPTNRTPTPKQAASAGFNLRTLVRDVCDTSNSADPGDLADEVFAKIPRKYIGEALKQSLRGYVRVVVGSDRSPEPDPVLHELSGDPVGVRIKPGNRSWKRDGVRKGYRARLQHRLHTGPESTAWKRLADCTYDDLMFAADERRHLAEQTLSRAVFYEELAKAVKDHGVTCVQELPDEALSAHLGNEGESE